VTDDLAAAIEDVRRPASEDHGERHDQAMDYARAARLLRLRAMRFTYAQIAEEEGYADGAGARNALIRALERHEAENVRELRALENLALDEDERMLRTVITDRSVELGTRIRAVDARTRLSARRARMNGLDAPVKVELSAGAQAAMDAALQLAEQVVTGDVLTVTDEPYDERLEG
jgi:hypothetical protein